MAEKQSDDKTTKLGKSRGWAKLREMGAAEINQKLSDVKHEVELYSEKVQISNKIVSRLLASFRGAREAGRSKQDKSVMTEKLPSKKKLIREINSLSDTIESKDKELSAQNDELKELGAAYREKKDEVGLLKKDILSLRSDVKSLQGVVQQLKEQAEQSPDTKNDNDLIQALATLFDHLGMKTSRPSNPKPPEDNGSSADGAPSKT